MRRRSRVAVLSLFDQIKVGAPIILVVSVLATCSGPILGNRYVSSVEVHCAASLNVFGFACWCFFDRVIAICDQASRFDSISACHRKVHVWIDAKTYFTLIVNQIQSGTNATKAEVSGLNSPPRSPRFMDRQSSGWIWSSVSVG